MKKGILAKANKSQWFMKRRGYEHNLQHARCGMQNTLVMVQMRNFTAATHVYFATMIYAAFSSSCAYACTPQATSRSRVRAKAAR